MEIRTTNPELEELIRILAANNAETTLREFAFQCAKQLRENFIRREGDSHDARSYPMPYRNLNRPPTRDETERIIRIIGIQKTNDPLAAMYLGYSCIELPSAQDAANQTAYWAREYTVLKGIQDGVPLDTINEQVNEVCVLQVKLLRTVILFLELGRHVS